MNEYNGTSEGWKRNRGKKPGEIDGTTWVETRRRSGMKYIGQAMYLHWTMNGGQGDIMAWRLPVEALNKQATKEAREIAQGKGPRFNTVEEMIADIEMKAFNPIDLRNEYNERKAEIEQYKLNIAQNEARMAAIETQLAEEGFALIEAKESAAEDMTNPANWKAGDLIECINENLGQIGETKKIKSIENKIIYRHDGGSCPIKFAHLYWKFHSRPQ